jgi:hypothetical protein
MAEDEPQDHEPEDEDRGLRNPAMLGVGIAIGAGLGTALFAATDNPVWIGTFVALGLAIGVALGQATGG